MREYKLLPMMGALMLCAATMGCEPTHPTTPPEVGADYVAAAGRADVYRVHDAKLGVTCWAMDRYNGGAAISCIPDTQLGGSNVR